MVSKNFKENVAARGFIIFKNSNEVLHRLTNGEFSETISSWKRTFFGPCQILVDPRLNYETARDVKFGVSTMGLCINPFDGSSDNSTISRNLYAALSESEDKFFEYVDQLSGSFVIFYRIYDKVKILQDCAATKPVYYSKDDDFGLIVSSHSRLLGQTLNLPRDPRRDHVFQNEYYKNDPSRYLPGDITPFLGMRTLTANTELIFETGTARRFFPRDPLLSRSADSALIDEIVNIFSQQAAILTKKNRPIYVAATAGRDSRLSVAAFARFEATELFSFHYPSTGHLSEDVEISKTLARISGKNLNTYDLSAYKDQAFDTAFKMTSPSGIWPAAALCYIKEFPSDAIHIRSTVSEIGRMFYRRRSSNVVSPEALSRSYTITDFWNSDIAIEAMRGFIEQATFDEKLFFNYNIYDMFYWEHRNSKWQNTLCQEAEMATDVFIPYNNRRLIQLFLSVPEADRQTAILHVEATKRLCPEFETVPYIS